MKKFDLLYYDITSQIFFVRFFGEVRKTKIAFKIICSLGLHATSVRLSLHFARAMVSSSSKTLNAAGAYL